MEHNSFRQFVTEWNVAHPIDHWWREKYNVPFNSAQHREMSFIDMRYEYEEDALYAELRRPDAPPAKVVEAYQMYQLNGQYLDGAPPVKITSNELSDLFDNLDLSQFDDPTPDMPENGVSLDD